MGTNKNSCKTAAVMNLLSGGGGGRVLPAQPKEPPVRDIEAITAEILNAKRAAGENILIIGRGLIEAKALLSHGEWLSWLENRVEFLERTAQRFMRLAREYANPTALSDLGATKALMLLALPANSRDEFLAEPHLVNGEEKNVIDMTSRELEAAIKERDAALKAAEEARAERSAAEQAREKIAEDMKLANERIAGLNAEAEAQAAKVKEARDAAARLEKELEELRSRPVEVAVETDTTAIEAARKEAEEKMRAQLDRAKKAQDKAEKARQTAEEAKTAAQKELSRVRAEAQTLREQTEKAAKKAALIANEDVVLFRTLFDQVQETVNRMTGVVMKVRNKEPEKAQGMERAMLALCEKIKEGTSFGCAERPSRQPSAAQEVAQG